MEEALKCSFM